MRAPGLPTIDPDLGITRLTIVQMYCFPYRSLDRHRATLSTEKVSHWPWYAYLPESVAP